MFHTSVQGLGGGGQSKIKQVFPNINFQSFWYKMLQVVAHAMEFQNKCLSNTHIANPLTRGEIFDRGVPRRLSNPDPI